MWWSFHSCDMHSQNNSNTYELSEVPKMNPVYFDSISTLADIQDSEACVIQGAEQTKLPTLLVNFLLQGLWNDVLPSSIGVNMVE